MELDPDMKPIEEPQESLRERRLWASFARLRTASGSVPEARQHEVIPFRRV